jgi:probable rRNA maturation factor
MPVASRRTGKRPTTDVRVAARSRIPLALAGIARLAAAVVRAEGARLDALSVAFVGEARIRTLNRTHLRHDRATDVLAFTLGAAGGPRLGDVYVCPAVAARQARAAGTTLKDELRRLVVHGVLHVCGHDHPAGAAARLASAMWQVQERHMAAFGRLAR